MQRVPQTQDLPPYSGTVVLLDVNALPLGSVETLAPGECMNLSISGTWCLVQAGPFARQPAAWGGQNTVAMTYTANLAASVWEGITGCFCDFNARERRDYLVLLTVCWRWASANWAYQYLGIQVDGSMAGMFPTSWTKRIDANPDTTDVFYETVQFILPNWPPGVHRVQAMHSPWGASQDRAITIAHILVC